MDNQNLNRRRNYFIDKKFQTEFIVRFCLLVVLGSSITAYIIYAMSARSVTTSFEGLRLTIKSTADYMMPALLISGAVVIVVVGVSTIIVTLLTSHKIAGPLYRIERNLSEVASGNLKMRFKLRKGDEIRRLASDLDAMVISLRDRIIEIKRSTDELDSLVGGMPETEAVKARESLDRLKKELETFKL